MPLIVEWNTFINMFYLLKHILLLILIIFKLKCINLIYNEIIFLNALYVYLHAFSLHRESSDLDPERQTPHFWGDSVTCFELPGWGSTDEVRSCSGAVLVQQWCSGGGQGGGGQRWDEFKSKMVRRVQIEDGDNRTGRWQGLCALRSFNRSRPTVVQLNVCYFALLNTSSYIITNNPCTLCLKIYFLRQEFLLGVKGFGRAWVSSSVWGPKAHLSHQGWARADGPCIASPHTSRWHGLKYWWKPVKSIRVKLVSSLKTDQFDLKI
jgi:hypothetical protein